MESTTENADDNLTSKSQHWLNFLLSQSQIFRKLMEIRQMGWNNESGDQYFKRQRSNADNAPTKLRRNFFKMMQCIGNEMQSKTGSLKLRKTEPLMLDLCMAPGGYTASVLKYNTDAHVDAITLPEASGGHEVLVANGDQDPRVQVNFADITMLAGELGNFDIPKDHPDAANFILGPLLPEGRYFHLIFCDGQVLRNHTRAAYRERVEASRLTLSQLIIALKRIQQSGTIVILLHKVDIWDSANLIFTFSKFGRVQLFKPQVSHALRSSFYLIAQDIDRHSPQFANTLAIWRKEWAKATFDKTDSTRRSPLAEDVNNLIDQFGARYIKMAEPIWEMQRSALAKAGFTSSKPKENS